MRKTLFSIILFLSACATTQAQEVRLGPLHSMDSPREDWILPGDTILQDGKKMLYHGKPVRNTSPTDVKKDDKQKKLNVSVDLSAFATFGKHTPHRGGFAQNISATYLTPLSKDGKLWIGGGGYLNNINWGGDNYHDVGLYAMMGYKFNEHWEAYIYGQLSITNNYNTLYGGYRGFAPYGIGYAPYSTGGTPLGGYGMGVPGANVLGAGVRYTNKNFSVGINVEGVWYDNKTPSYYGKYKYPVPSAE